MVMRRARHSCIDIAYRIVNDEVACIRNLGPYKDKIERLARLRTTVGRKKTISLARLMGEFNVKHLQKLLDVAYISDRILSHQSKRIQTRHSRYRTMAERLVLVSPDFISQMAQSFNSNVQPSVQQPIYPPPQANLRIANDADKTLSAMETGAVPYDGTVYNKTMSKHLGNLNVYRNKLQNPTSGPDGLNDEVLSKSPNGEVTSDIVSKQRSQLLGTVPKVFAKQAENIFDFVNNSNGRIKFDSNNAAVLDGKKIDNSNLIDYIAFLVGKKRRTPKMPGLSNFISILRDLGLPKSLLNDPVRLNMLETGSVPADFDPLVSNNVSSPVATPPRDKRRRSVHKHQPDPVLTSSKKKKKRGGLRGTGVTSYIKKPKRGVSTDAYKGLTPKEYAEFSRWLRKA